jgi:hypothetical protein
MSETVESVNEGFGLHRHLAGSEVLIRGAGLAHIIIEYFLLAVQGAGVTLERRKPAVKPKQYSFFYGQERSAS